MAIRSTKSFLSKPIINKYNDPKKYRRYIILIYSYMYVSESDNSNHNKFKSVINLEKIAE